MPVLRIQLAPTKSQRNAWLFAAASCGFLVCLLYMLQVLGTRGPVRDDLFVAWLALLPTGLVSSMVSLRISKQFVVARIACGISVAVYVFLMASAAFMHWLLNLSGIQNPGPG
ncbi:hypothetical protein [Novipirellula artificiosorum]|nr:hypothetical protein [Novipirellula artificiosorum]